MLENVVLGNPQLGVLTQLLEAARPRRGLPAAPGASGRERPADAEVRPVLRPDRRDGACFALSCFGLLLFLWLAFGGPVPLKPKGYRVDARRSREASQLATEADVRISGVPVGKVKTIEPDAETGPLRRDDRARRQVRAAAVGRAGDPAPEDAAGRDLRRADARHANGAERCPRAAGCAEGQRLRDRRARRDPAHVRPARRARRSRTGCRRRREAIAGHGRDINDALGNLGPFADDAAELVDILNRQEPAVQRLISRHRASCSRR